MTEAGSGPASPRGRRTGAAAGPGRKMRIHWSRTTRLPRFPLWATAIVVGWAAVIAAVQFLPFFRRHDLNACMFLRLTGLPCPSCGSTRAVLALTRGEILRAFAWNPLITAFLATLVLYLGTRILTGWAPRVRLTRTERILALTLLVALVLGNWAWVITHL